MIESGKRAKLLDEDGFHREKVRESPGIESNIRSEDFRLARRTGSEETGKRIRQRKG